jgi:hypothetical protein
MPRNSVSQFGQGDGFFRRGGVGPSFGLVACCLFGEPERFQPRGVHVNSPRLSLMLRCRLGTFRCGLLLFLELRFGPGPCFF